MDREVIARLESLLQILSLAEIDARTVLSNLLRLKPDCEKLRREEVRLRTFHDWPLGAQVRPQVLAREGLFYTGTEDRVQCVFCRGFMRNWESTDIPSVEHKKHFPDCAFVRGQDIGNVPIAIEPNDAGVPIAIEPNDAGHETDDDDHEVVNKVCGKIQEQLEVENQSKSTRPHTRKQVLPVNVEPPAFPDYGNISQRLRSFQRGQVSWGHTAEDQAEAGWFWIGPGDQVKCFQCSGNLRNWRPEDDPWDEHKKWYANCSYIRNHFPSQGIQFQDQLQEHKKEKVPVENFSNVVFMGDGIDDILGPNSSSDSHVTRGVQVEDNGQLNSNRVVTDQPQGTPFDALMDREEIQVVLHIMEACHLNRDNLKTVVAERLFRGEDCLIPKVLLEAVFEKYPF